SHNVVVFYQTRHDDILHICDHWNVAVTLRLRSLLMTSFALILGVVPLLIATGAGASSRRALGTAVFGGMNAATMLAIFIVPVLYYTVQRFAERRSANVPHAAVEVER